MLAPALRLCTVVWVAGAGAARPPLAGWPWPASAGRVRRGRRVHAREVTADDQRDRARLAGLRGRLGQQVLRGRGGLSAVISV